MVESEPTPKRRNVLAWTFGILGLVLLASLATNRYWGPIERLGGQGHIDYVYVPPSLLQDRPALEREVRDFCDHEGHPGRFCWLVLWSERSAVPKHAPIGEASLELQVGAYNRNPSTGLDKLWLETDEE